MLSEAVENYLTEILRLEEAGTTASTSALATRLQVARPSVTGMLKRLADDRLVTYRPYRGAHLTSTGRRAARDIVRRHRLVETFLVRALQMAPDRVHDEAHRWEHVLSDDAVERLDRWLGRPTTDPHGSPIPGAIDHVANTSRLTSLAPGQSATVIGVDSPDSDHTDYLTSLGLIPGAPVTMIERRPHQGPVTLDVSGGWCIVGAEVTEYVTIREEEDG